LKGSENVSLKEGIFRRPVACLVASVVLLVAGCAGIERRLFERPFDPEAVAALRADLLDQSERVKSVFSAGQLLVKGWRGQDLEAAVFSAWLPSPLKIKVEVTHPWGQPMLHLLVDGEDFRLLSFAERKVYDGPFTTSGLSMVLPGDLDQRLLQDLMRAYPVLDPEHRARSNEPNRISFYGAQAMRLA
jgi:hypothetical protein